MIFIIRIFVEFLIFIFSIFIISMFCIFIHEIGHAIGYILATKDNDWNISIGKGKEVCKIGKFNIHLIPFSGYCSHKSISKTKRIVTLIGGPLATPLLLLLLFLVKDSIDSLLQAIVALTDWDSLIKYFMCYNLYMFIFSVLPLKFDGYISDGLQILQTIKGNNDN